MISEDTPTLPADTLRLLAEFQAERDARERSFQDLKAQSEADFGNVRGKLTMELFGEDWNASQFWYSDQTATTLAQQLLNGADASTSIAVVSAPSVYIQLRNILAEQEDMSARPTLRLLEYDQRFEVLGSDFVSYDFQHPLRLPTELKGKFDRIICDPPFLSEDCQTKTALTVRYLAKSWSGEADGPDGCRFISCTGERMGAVIEKLYGKLGTRTTTFEPQHTKGLSNEFRCYANFECADWKWQS